MEWVKVPGWTRYSWLRHGFTTRRGGDTGCYGGHGELNLGLTAEDRPETVLRNREMASSAVGGPEFQLATLRQVHGTSVLRAAAAGRAGDGDGLVTAEPGLLLGVLAADCVPILLVDVRRRAVAALHAGWRGTAAQMAKVGVEQMLADGSLPGDLLAAVGPSIGPCCYQVGAEVQKAFGNRGVFRGEQLDLWETNRQQLIAAGLRSDQVAVIGECTVCSRFGDGGRKYFSHRAEDGQTGRMMGLIGVAREHAP